MGELDRRTFLKQFGVAAGGLAIAGPLQALTARTAAGATPVGGGYGPLVDMGDLLLPSGFQYRVLSRQGEPLADGSPTPSFFDGMGAFPGPAGSTILIRNHENRNLPGEVPVPVPSSGRYDPLFNAGCTKVVVSPDLRVEAAYPVLGGTFRNCAGGAMPWGSWISCEEGFTDGNRRHGYAFEIDVRAEGPVEPVPIRAAGRFIHEAVAWHDGVLYLTEDRPDAAFYRYLPERQPQRPGDLAAAAGTLQALRIVGMPAAQTARAGIAAGQAFAVDWVTIGDPDPAQNVVRFEAHAAGAAYFERTEGIHRDGDRIYFDCTTGGAAAAGQIWELDPAGSILRLVYESTSRSVLKQPDNLTVTPAGHVLLCEDSEMPVYLRGITPAGEIYDFARAVTVDSEFAGACFGGPEGRTLFVNQMGDGGGTPSTTYAIWGPWERVGGVR